MMKQKCEIFTQLLTEKVSTGIISTISLLMAEVQFFRLRMELVLLLTAMVRKPIGS